MELSNTTTRRLGLASMRASKSWRPSNILAPMMLSGGLSNTALQYAGVSSMMRRCDDDLVMTHAPHLTCSSLAPKSPRPCLSQAARLQIRDVTTDIELELAGDPKTAFAGFGHPLKCFRPPQGRAEACLRRPKLDFVGPAGVIEDRLGCAQRLAIE